MKNSSSVVYSFALILSDFLALLAAFIGAYILRVTLDDRSLVNQITSDEYLQTFLILVPLWIVIFAFLGLYRRNVYDYRWREIILLGVGSVVGTMAFITYDFIIDESIFPARLVPVYSMVLGFLLLVLSRTLMRGFRIYMWRTGFGVNRVLALGSGETLQGLVKNLQKPSRTGFDLVAVATKDELPSSYKGTVINNYSEALSDLPGLGVNTVLVTGLDNDSKLANEALAAAQSNHAAYKYIPLHAGILSNNIEVELFQSLPVVSVHQTALVGWGRIVKRLFDIAASFGAMILLSPIYLIIAMLIKIDDRGDIFLKQARLSRFNSTIYIYKFRTHKISINGLSPEEAFAKLGKPNLAKKYRENGDYLENDPRVTKIGKFLRKTSLDELPQLFNVFKGDISLVGPRALMPIDLKNYAYKDLILSVKSGITGLAQTSGRRDIGFEERRALDLYYVQNWSFWMDIKILFRTVLDVLTGRGAK